MDGLEVVLAVGKTGEHDCDNLFEIYQQKS